MKKIFAAVLLVLLSASCLFAQEVITDFHQDILIFESSDIQVKETIKISVENINIKHGIIRKFPIRRKDAEGRNVRVDFVLESVLLDGKPVACTSDYSDDFCELRIGRRDTFISRGLHEFTLLYTAKGEIGFFEDHDELYWNVTGNEWTFPILHASCALRLPGKNFGEGFEAIKWYVGTYGQKGDKADARLDADNLVHTTRALSPGEDLTVAYGWQKGLVTQPALARLDDPKAHTCVALTVFVAILAWLLYAWRRFGKDPVKTVIPLFHAPDGFSPAAVQYGENLKFDSKTMLSANLVDMAVKGALNIEQTGGERKLLFKTKVNYILHKKQKVAELTKDEEKLYAMLFENAKSVDFSTDISDTLIAAQKSVKALCKQLLGKLYNKNNGPMYVAALIYAIGVALLYIKSNEEFPYDMFVCGLLGFFMFIVAMNGDNKPEDTGIAKLLKKLCIQLFFAFVGLAILHLIGNNPLPYLIFCASMFILSVFRPLIAARNEHGAELLAQVKGLKMYMTTAERERLEMLNAPEDTPQLFEKLLPYALALGVAKTWANRFSDVLTAAAYKPDWCTGGTIWVPMDFTTSFGNNLHKASVPVSQNGGGSFGGDWMTGLGGGGFSGGGGGGGGGSGW